MVSADDRIPQRPAADPLPPRVISVRLHFPNGREKTISGDRVERVQTVPTFLLVAVDDEARTIEYAGIPFAVTYEPTGLRGDR